MEIFDSLKRKFFQTKGNFGSLRITDLRHYSHGQPTARGPHAALEALQCGPSTVSEKRYFGAKSIRSLEKVQILALKMTIFQKCGPRADLGWPWLV